MQNASVIHSTFQLERQLKASPERVFAAFSNSAAKRRWFFASDSYAVEHHELDFQVGGKERAQLRMGPGNPVAGKTIINETVYEDIVPARRIVTAYRMSMDGKPFSAALATIEFLPAGSSTDLVLTHQGAYFEGADGPDLRKGGWESLLNKLVKELDE